MHIITKRDINFIEKQFEWSMGGHITNIYDRFCFRDYNPTALPIKAEKKCLLSKNF